MADRPILFSGAMVRALIEGRKTQTRRIIKPQAWNKNRDIVDISLASAANYIRGSDGRMYFQFDHPRGGPLTGHISYINVGDRLWVREAHSIHSAHGMHRADGARWGPWGGLPTMLSRDTSRIAYFREGFDRCDPARWRPSIHMPRWASRLTLDVTDVRVQRLQDISEADACAEGVFVPEAQYAQQGSRAPVLAFAALWESINGLGSWTANAWVVAYTFVVHQCNIDELGVAP